MLRHVGLRKHQHHWHEDAVIPAARAVGSAAEPGRLQELTYTRGY